jgi:hypothetical protein
VHHPITGISYGLHGKSNLNRGMNLNILISTSHDLGQGKRVNYKIDDVIRICHIKPIRV